MRAACLMVMVLFTVATFATQQSSAPAPKTELRIVTLYVEGDSSVIPKFINLCRQMGPERGLDFHFVDRQLDKWDYRVVLSAEGSGVWNYAQGNIVVLNPDAKVTSLLRAAIA